MRELRGGLSPEERARLARLIEDRVFRVPAFKEAGTVMLFSSFGAEVPTHSIAARLAAEGRRVVLPFLEANAMHAAELLPDEALEPSTYGPGEPRSRVAIDPREVDAVVAPGLAFDRHGFRLGYGGGHYDRYLRTLRPQATRVGIAFHVQLLEAVPHSRRDEPVGIVVTEGETVFCRRSA
jgi:5-formyltetrahydrofolate cyclo-ligase